MIQSWHDDPIVPVIQEAECVSTKGVLNAHKDQLAFA